MARLAETVAALLNSPMSLLDLFHFIAVQGGQAVEEPNPVFICGSIDPLGVFFDFAPLFFKMPYRPLDLYSASPEFIPTCDTFVRFHGPSPYRRLSQGSHLRGLNLFSVLYLCHDQSQHTEEIFVRQSDESTLNAATVNTLSARMVPHRCVEKSEQN
jgi:hypothetical protein